ncbi:MAG: DUF4242 domain-containing protein [Acidobacteriota bacterium]
MPKYVIEREIPQIGSWAADQLKAASKTSCKVLNDLGPDIEWLDSYVTGDKLYCVYVAANEDIIREHGRLGGFPVNKISEVIHVIGPETAKD